MKTVKKVFSVLMTLVIVLTIIPMTAMESEAVANKTKAEAVAWINSRVGKNVTNVDGAAGYQCVDLVLEYYQFLGVSGGGGNACDYSSNTLPAGFTRIQDYYGFVPEPGDIAVWDVGNGAYKNYGHVGLVISADLNNIHIAEVWGGGGSDPLIRDNTMPYNSSGWYEHFWGVIRPAYASSSVSTTGISLNTKQFTLGVGASKTITATVTPSNATNKNVTWSSSDTSVVTVSGGVVKAVGAGGAVITAKTASGGYEAYAEVVVNEASIRPILTSFYNGHYYELYSQHMAWDQAKTFCENRGGHLVTINSEGENDAILKMITEVQPQTSDYTGFFIGISDADATQGEYKWITEEELTYENWADGEPNNTLWSACHERYQDYGLINTNGQWCDTNNYQNVRSHVGFIYEHDVPQEPDAVTVIDGKVYELWDRQYIITAADDFAKEKGGYLLSLTSAEEQAAVGTWLRANTNSKYIALGATDEETEGVWKWTSGEPWSYTNWNTGEPNNTNGIENNAIWILSSDNWNDTNADNAYAFVIEYTLDDWLKQGNSLNDILFDKLPDGANPDDYNIITEYRFRDKSTTTSTADSMDGWTKYDSETTYGTWSSVKSTSTKPTTSDTLQITGTWTQYHYFHYVNYYDGCYNIDSIPYGTTSGKHTIDRNSALSPVSFADQGGKQAYGSQTCSCGFNYWFLSGTTLFYNYQTRSKTTTNYFYKWSDWTPWTTTPITATDNREVETRTVYSLKDTPATTVTAISVVSKPSKTVYTQNEELDTSGLSLRVTYSDGTSKTITEGFTVSAPDMTTAGTKTVTVSYSGKTTAFTIKVKSSTPAITVDSRNAVCGQRIKVPVILEKAEIGTLIMDITYDSTKLQLAFVEGIPFDMARINTDTAGKIRITAMDNTCVSAGTIAVLTFDVVANEACSTNISVSVDRAYDADDNEVDLTVFNGTLEISKPSYGDINDDGSLDSADYAMIRAYATGNEVLDDVQKIAADLNRDGAVDAYDAIYLDLYLNGYLDTL